MANECLLFVTGLLVVAVAVTYASTKTNTSIVASNKVRDNRVMSL